MSIEVRVVLKYIERSVEFAVLIDGNAIVDKVGRSVIWSFLKVMELSVGRKLPMDEVSLINGLWLEVKFTESEDFAALKGDTVLGVITISVEVKLNNLVVLFELLNVACTAECSWLVTVTS